MKHSWNTSNVHKFLSYSILQLLQKNDTFDRSSLGTPFSYWQTASVKIINMWMIRLSSPVLYGILRTDVL